MASKTQRMDAVECCRTCMTETESSNEMISIFTPIYSLTAADMISSCTSIKINYGDSLPKIICDSCFHCLQEFYEFRKQAEAIDVQLHTKAVENNMTDVKLEVKDNPPDYTDCSLDNTVDQYYDDIKIELKQEQEHNDMAPHVCTICLEVFQNESHLRCHNKMHLDKITFKCDECDKQFRKQSKLERHKRTHDKGTYVCTVCSETFKYHTKYVNHLIQHSQSEPEERTENQSYECDKCSATFKSIHSLSGHMRKHSSKDRILSCNICQKVFKKVSHLKRHELCHENNRPYKCPLCPQSFTSEIIFKEHANKHAGVKSHACPICSKAFSHLSSLNTHVKTHTKEKSYLCPTCGKKFDSSTNLNQHMRRHLGLKLFACSLCPKRFVSKGELKSHVSTHTGERAHTCEQCGATFTKRSSLRKHALRHRGIKPHPCDACTMRFTSKDHLKRHYRIHTGEKPYRCTLCDRAFTQSNDLAKHRRAHLGDKLYELVKTGFCHFDRGCHQCSESFRLKTELTHHISQHFVAQLASVVSVENDNKLDKCDNYVPLDVTRNIVVGKCDIAMLDQNSINSKTC